MSTPIIRQLVSRCPLIAPRFSEADRPLTANSSDLMKAAQRPSRSIKGCGKVLRRGHSGGRPTRTLLRHTTAVGAMPESEHWWPAGWRPWQACMGVSQL